MSESDHTPIYDRIDKLAERVNELEQRVSELEAETAPHGTVEPSASVEGTLDRYDAGVLDGLEAGDTLSLEGLQTRYRKTGIVQQSTIKQRIKRLTSLDYFSRDGRTWRFEGVENE